MSTFDTRTVWITGASSSIGKALAERCAAEVANYKVGNSKTLTHSLIRLQPGYTLSNNFYSLSALIISAAFSAIIIVGAFVLPEMRLGIMEASTTLSPLSP